MSLAVIPTARGMRLPSCSLTHVMSWDPRSCPCPWRGFLKALEELGLKSRARPVQMEMGA